MIEHDEPECLGHGNCANPNPHQHGASCEGCTECWDKCSPYCPAYMFNP